MGKPEYITRIKDMRGDFSNIKIKPKKLVDFEMSKASSFVKSERKVKEKKNDKIKKCCAYKNACGKM